MRFTERSAGWSIRQKFHALMAILIGMSMLFGVGGILIFRDMVGEFQRTEATSIAMRNHLEAGMMLGAIRATVMQARHSAATGDASGIVRARQDMRKYGHIFKRQIAKNQSLVLDSAVKASLDRIDAPLHVYLMSAERAVDLAARKSDRAPRQFKQFSARFARLQAAMSDISDQLEANLHAQSEASAAEATIAQWGLALNVLLILALMVWTQRIVAKTMIQPLESAAESLMLLANGKQSVDIEGIERADELGELARGIVAFRDTVAVAQTAEEAQAMVARLQEAEWRTTAAHDDQKRAEEDRRRALRDLAAALEQRVLAAVETVAATAQGVQDISANMARAARETRSEISIAAGTGTQIVGNMQEVATATSQLSDTAQSIGGLMATAMAHTASAAQRGVHATERTEHLVMLANNVGAVASMIGDIARQTNQLALNATIEATRAGEAGRGFAVVAAEVKTLANETARATHDVAQQIAAIQTIVAEVNGAINDVHASVSEVEQVSASAAQSIEEQSLATAAIGRNIHEVTSGTRGLSSSVAAVETIARRGDDQAQLLVDSAKQLDRLSADLRAGVVEIIAEVRAA